MQGPCVTMNRWSQAISSWRKSVRTVTLCSTSVGLPSLQSCHTLFRCQLLNLGLGPRLPCTLRALVPAEPKISERILCPLYHTSSNRHVRTLRISEPHFALPRQQLTPISS